MPPLAIVKAVTQAMACKLGLTGGGKRKAVQVGNSLG